MNVTAYDIALRRIERIPIYCSKPAHCSKTVATEEIKRVLKSHNSLNYMYPSSSIYVYKLDKVYEESELVMA